MQKVIYIHFKKFIVSQHGFDFWIDATKKYAHLKLEALSAEVFLGVINKIVEKLKITMEALLVKFGLYTSQTLLALYGNNIKPEWNTLDTLENLNNIITQVVAKFNDTINPPRIIIQRNSCSKLELIYKSHEIFPYLGRGLIEGIATYFNEKDQTQLNMNMRMNGTTTFKVSLKEASIF